MWLIHNKHYTQKGRVWSSIRTYFRIRNENICTVLLTWPRPCVNPRAYTCALSTVTGTVCDTVHICKGAQMQTFQPPSFAQVMLKVTIMTHVNKHHHLVDVNRFIEMCVPTLESTPWTVGVDPSLLIVT